MEMHKKQPAYFLGINPGWAGLNYHDPAVAILCNNELVFAAEEERFTRQKHACGTFPRQAMAAALDQLGIDFGEITSIAIAYSPQDFSSRVGLEAKRTIKARLSGTKRHALWDGMPFRLDGSDKLEADISQLIARNSALSNSTSVAKMIASQIPADVFQLEKISFIRHHEAHAMSAHCCSGFAHGLSVICDGVAEVDSSSAFMWTNGRMKRIWRQKLPDSLGYFYAAITEFLGFRAWDGEGKLMALAAYGKPDPAIAKVLQRLVKWSDHGPSTRGLVDYCLDNYLQFQVSLAKDYLSLVLSLRPRIGDQPIEDIHRSIAYEAQAILEEFVIALTRVLIARTGTKNVAFAGGVFLNCKLNQRLRETFRRHQVYFQPVAGDAGSALGAACAPMLSAGLGHSVGLARLDLGYQYGRTRIERAIAHSNLPFVKIGNDFSDVAALLASGCVVCWYQGRSEYGPRALGSRSILADPRIREVRDRVNSEIKHRECWRPFGCSVLHEFGQSIFDGYPLSRQPSFMIETFRVRREWADRLPAIIHTPDGTSRPQSVSHETGPLYKLLNSFLQLTGVPVLLNTSLNGQGDPLVETPEEALKFFIEHSVDAIVLGEYLIRRPHRC